MKTKILICLALTTLLLLTACQKTQDQLNDLWGSEETPETPENQLPTNPEPTSEPELEPEIIEEINLACTHNENCSEGKLCIQGECQLLNTFYTLDETCQKCIFTKVNLVTSDGETYSVPPGQGSYTAGGALEWDIWPSSQYCQGEEPIVPIKILKRNYGEIFADELVMIKVGQTSKVITHPLVSSIQFTLTINNVEETCS